jgi:NADH-quinone oxidoreductase subunit E
MSTSGSRDGAKRAGEEIPFDLPEEMAAAVRLMANPAAGAIAISALGLGIASHALGFWAGALTGAVQASQRLFVPLQPESTGAGTAKPTSGLRDKPFLKVVAKNEPPAAAPVAQAMESTLPSPTPAVQRRQPGSAPTPKVAKATIPASVAEPAAKTESPLQPEDFHKPRALERPAVPDELKAISGIGPKLEKVLNDLGIWTYAQIAAWENREVAWIDDYLGFRGRIDRDGWIEQARALSAPSGQKGS